MGVCVYSLYSSMCVNSVWFINDTTLPPIAESTVIIHVSNKYSTEIQFCKWVCLGGEHVGDMVVLCTELAVKTLS